MRCVPAMDATALHSLKKVFRQCKKKGITLVFSHVMEQPLSVMQKAGFYEEVGEINYCGSIDSALERAVEIQNKVKQKSKN